MKRIVSSVLSIIFFGSLAVGATGAFFSDTETSEDNTFVAGIIDMTVGNYSIYNGEYSTSTSWLNKDLETGNLFFDFHDVKPGDWGMASTSIKLRDNESWLCLDIELTENAENGVLEPEKDYETSTSSGELAENLNVVVWYDYGKGYMDFHAYHATATLSQSISIPYHDSEHYLLYDSRPHQVEPLKHSTTTGLGIGWCFGDLTPTPFSEGDYPSHGGFVKSFECDGSNPELNGTQSDSAQYTISLRMVQARHNDTFTCGESTLPPRSLTPIGWKNVLVSNISSSEAPDVAVGDDTVAVTWAGSYGNLYLSILDFDGNKILSDYQVSTSSSIHLRVRRPKIIWNGSDFALIWAARSDEASRNDLYFARFDRIGNPLIGNKRLTYSISNEYADYPDIRSNGDNYTIVWKNRYAAKLAIIDKDGNFFLPEKKIFTELIEHNYIPTITRSEGGFGIVTKGYSDTTSPKSVHVLIIDENGTQLNQATEVVSCVNGCEYPDISWSGTTYGISYIDRTNTPKSDLKFIQADLTGSAVSTSTLVMDNVKRNYSPIIWDGTEYKIIFTYGNTLGIMAINALNQVTVGPLGVADEGWYPRYPTIDYRNGKYVAAWQDYTSYGANIFTAFSP